MQELSKATEPTMYFVGVTTGQSSIMKVFPAWMEALGINAVMKGIDLPLHAPAADYRKVVSFMRDDPLSLGALVTTHKLDLFESCSDMFDYVDPYAQSLEEVSSLSKRGEKLCAHAKDPITSGLALESFIPENFWQEHDGEVLILGAGGSSLAMSMYLAQKEKADNVPKRITITNRSSSRLMAAQEKLVGLNELTEFRFAHCPDPKDNDAYVSSLSPYSLIVNATGLGKDAPGSPTTDNVIYPQNSQVWEINYRGDLLFKAQAERQESEHNLHVEDGWNYFIYGWTSVIAEVFHIEINSSLIAELSQIAQAIKGK